MMTRTLRTFALASFLTAGLVTWSGCNTENPDGTPNALGKMEEKAKKVEDKVGEGAKKAEEKAEEGLKKAGAAVGEKLEEGGKKLQEISKPDAPKEVMPKVDAPKEEAPKEAPKS